MSGVASESRSRGNTVTSSSSPCCSSSSQWSFLHCSVPINGHAKLHRDILNSLGTDSTKGIIALGRFETSLLFASTTDFTTGDSKRDFLVLRAISNKGTTASFLVSTIVLLRLAIPCKIRLRFSKKSEVLFNAPRSPRVLPSLDKSSSESGITLQNTLFELTHTIRQIQNSLMNEIIFILLFFRSFYSIQSSRVARQWTTPH